MAVTGSVFHKTPLLTRQNSVDNDEDNPSGSGTNKNNILYNNHNNTDANEHLLSDKHNAGGTKEPLLPNNHQVGDNNDTLPCNNPNVGANEKTLPCHTPDSNEDSDGDQELFNTTNTKNNNTNDGLKNKSESGKSALKHNQRGLQDLHNDWLSFESYNYPLTKEIPHEEEGQGDSDDDADNEELHFVGEYNQSIKCKKPGKGFSIPEESIDTGVGGGEEDDDVTGSQEFNNGDM